MRVIAGELKSRRFDAPPGVSTRPTSDKLRETLFDILGPRVRGALFVDAYAGSGAVGIEAWSRGARPVIWIENARASLSTLRDNLRALGVAADPGSPPPAPGQGAAVVVAGAVLPSLPRLEKLVAGGGGCDFFFLDPPYAHTRERETVLDAIERSPRLVRPGGLVIAETRRGDTLTPRNRNLRLERIQTQGDSQLAFYRATATPAAPLPNAD